MTLLALAETLLALDPDPEVVEARVLDASKALERALATSEGAAAARFRATLPEGWLDDIVLHVAVVRSSELDDIHMPSLVTAGSVVVPVALAFPDAEDIGAAVAAGYEAMTRLGLAIGGAFLMERGLWPTYFAAPFGAAAVAARLLGLGARQTAEALGHALTRTTGAGGGVHGALPSRWLAVGDAARAGVLGALAAREGFTADVDLTRFADTHRIDFDMEAFLGAAQPAIDQVSVKPYPCAKQALAAAEAGLKLRERNDHATRIRVFVPEAYVSMVARPPEDGVRLSKIASVAWNVALALTRPDALLDPERRLSVDDPGVGPIARGVEVLPDPELSRLYPQRFAARVEIDGISETVVDAAGDPGTSGNSLTGVREKWQRLG